MHFDPYLGAYSESMFIGLWRSIVWLYHKVSPTAEQCLDHIERNIDQLESIPVDLRNSDLLHGEVRYRFRQIHKFDERYHSLCFKLFWRPSAAPSPGADRYGRLYLRLEGLNQSFGVVHV